MTGVLHGVDQRTQMVGHNRLELLLFRLAGKQRYGINVFKVLEVMPCPPLTRMPKSHPSVRGVSHIRGRTIPIMDLGLALGLETLPDPSAGHVIIAEYNRSVQAFLVWGIDRIVHMSWTDITPPPRGCGPNGYLTAVTRLGEELIEIIDVEKVLDEVAHRRTEVSRDLAASGGGKPVRILVVDDSSVARNQITRTLEQIGVESVVARNGREALDMLRGWTAEGRPITEHLGMMISDIEMPEMDGYTLTAELKKDPQLKDLFVLLHSSLSGVFNDAMVTKVGADRFLAKFDADALARQVLERIRPAAAGAH
jgi:two-component system chemotaxis response regulator CheV